MTFGFEVLTGDRIAPALEDVARLRITVFRDYPYLYDGTLEYERDYLATFAKAEGAVIVVARDAGAIVGASTGCLLRSEHAEFRQPFEARGLDVNSIFYCAESVLLPEYRGQGAGHRFFDAREAHARALGMRQSAFCAVQRPPDHPLRPADYTPLDTFWRRRGYAPVEGLIAHFLWRDRGENHDTPKPLQFWMREL